MSDPVLSVRNLQVDFISDERIVKAVDGIDLTLHRGQTLGIVGESGSGKSVTSLAVMGLVPSPGVVAGGEIWFKKPNEEAVDLLRLNPERRRQYRGGEMAMIFQEPMSSLNPVYTIGFQLIEAIRQHQSLTEREARHQAVARLQEVRLLPSDEELRVRFQQHSNNVDFLVNSHKLAMLERFPHELSGGQLQRVMIAIAISCNPTLLIADEPTTALDVTVQAAILNLLRELRDARGMSMLFITHDLGIIAEIADVVAVMYQGKIVEVNSVMEIFSNPQHPYTKGLLACRPRLDRTLKHLPTVSDFMEVVTTSEGVTSIQEKAVSLQEVIQAVEAKKTGNQLGRKPILEIKNLRVGFPERSSFGLTKGYVMAVNDVSFEVYTGETLGLVGESGCGKTTLARTLIRLINPMGGEIVFEGNDITHLSGKRLRQLQREIQIVFQNPYSSLDPRMKIGEAVMEPLLIHNRSNKQGRRDRAVYLLERVGLSADWLNRYPHQLSGGQRQRVCIARALALNPKFIICDESVSALDVSVQAQVLNLLKELQAEFELTYIFISHDLSVVKFMSDRIMVMNQGKIEEIDTAETIYREPATEYTRKLIDAIPTGSLERITAQQIGRVK